MPREPEPLQPGDPFGYREAGVPKVGERSSAWLNDAADLIRRGGPATPGLGRERLDPGDRRRPIMARLVGQASPYSWLEVFPGTTGATWHAHRAGRGGASNAYEVNGVAGLHGKVVRLRPGAPGDYRFQYDRIGREPQCPSPELITVRIRNYCIFYGAEAYVAGATVTARDGDGNEAGTATTDAQGYATIELDEPGTYDVDVTVGDCTETIEDVVVAPCEHRKLPDFTPCCGGIRVTAYDYDTGSPVVGATVSLDGSFGTTDGAGVIVLPPPLRYSPGFITVTHPDYLDRRHLNSCADCDCEAVQDVPIALFPRSAYVAACGLVGGICPAEPCVYTTRDLSAFKRRLFAGLSGAEAVVGAGLGSVALDLVSTPGTCPNIWEGWGPGGYGYKVTLEWDAGLGGLVEVDRERYDFPAARVRFVEGNWAGRVGDPLNHYLEVVNYLDPEGTVPANRGHVFETSGTPFQPGWTRVLLEPEGYCPSPLAPGVPINAFPTALRNYLVAHDGRGLAEAEVCGASTARKLVLYQGRGAAWTCAPIDVAGVFWCDDCSPFDPYERHMIAYELHE